MKGRKLTLQEVLKLEDGTKVWVEDNRRGYTDELCIYKKDDNILLVISDNTNYVLDVIGVYNNKLKFYEWIEEFSYSKTLESVQNIMKEIQYDAYLPLLCQTEINTETPLTKMAQEICNLRGLDLTDDNIRLIVEEFEEGK